MKKEKGKKWWFASSTLSQGISSAAFLSTTNCAASGHLPWYAVKMKWQAVPNLRCSAGSALSESKEPGARIVAKRLNKKRPAFCKHHAFFGTFREQVLSAENRLQRNRLVQAVIIVARAGDFFFAFNTELFFFVKLLRELWQCPSNIHRDNQWISVLALVFQSARKEFRKENGRFYLLLQTCNYLIFWRTTGM